MILSVLPQVGHVAPLYNLLCMRMQVLLWPAVVEASLLLPYFSPSFGQLSVPGRIDPWYCPPSLCFPWLMIWHCFMVLRIWPSYNYSILVYGC